MAIELLGKEVRFPVPMLRNSDHEIHDISIWEWLENQMYVEFPNGWQLREVERTDNTVLGTVRGRWFDKDKNESVPDDCVEYVVAVGVLWRNDTRADDGTRRLTVGSIGRRSEVDDQADPLTAFGGVGRSADPTERRRMTRWDRR